MAHRLTYASTAPAATLAQVKAQLGYLDNDRDDELLDLAVRATRYVERMAGILLRPATVTQRLEGFPRGCEPVVELEIGPVRSVTSIGYTDAAGDAAELIEADWQVDLYSNPARIKPAWNAIWPTYRTGFGAVAIEYEAGPVDVSACPAAAVQAVLLLVERWFANGEVNDGMDMAGTLHSLICDLKGGADDA